MQKERKLYIAYGSNLNFSQMAMRCPDAKFKGVGLINDYEIVFRGNKNSGVATIEPCAGKSVPVGIWEISDSDEVHLDVYEGFPNFYTKKYMKMVNNDTNLKAMIYVMNDGFKRENPSDSYYNTIKQGYKDCGLDESVFEDYVQDNNAVVNNLDVEGAFPLGYKDIRW